MKLKTPTDWSGVTISQWQALRDLAEDFKEEGDSLTYRIRQLAILADIREDQAREVSLQEYKLYKEQFMFITDSPVGEAPASFKVEGKKYEPRLDMQSLSASEYIDLTEYSKDPEENAHDLLALLCVGPGTAQERADLFFHHLTMDTAYPMLLFFWQVWSDFTASILHSLIQQSQETMSQSLETPQGSVDTHSIGGGSSPSTASQEVTELSGPSS
jgi:hypothetical protein